MTWLRFFIFLIYKFKSGLSSYIDPFSINHKTLQIRLAKAINEVSHTLNKKTIAEGIDDENIIKLLRELDFNRQGFYFGMPEEVNINKTVLLAW